MRSSFTDFQQYDSIAFYLIPYLKIKEHPWVENSAVYLPSISPGQIKIYLVYKTEDIFHTSSVGGLIKMPPKMGFFGGIFFINKSKQPDPVSYLPIKKLQEFSFTGIPALVHQ